MYMLQLEVGIKRYK